MRCCGPGSPASLRTICCRWSCARTASCSARGRPKGVGAALSSNSSPNGVGTARALSSAGGNASLARYPPAAEPSYAARSLRGGRSWSASAGQSAGRKAPSRRSAGIGDREAYRLVAMSSPGGPDTCSARMHPLSGSPSCSAMYFLQKSSSSWLSPMVPSSSIELRQPRYLALNLPHPQRTSRVQFPLQGFVNERLLQLRSPVNRAGMQPCRTRDTPTKGTATSKR
mmetsp:Transcript_55758/g.156482  ORF Transcript_55758/g.156482 Transcript_55758/m.156482 type:complete len:226 (-) Transcript_55758:91-768(-)